MKRCPKHQLTPPFEVGKRLLSGKGIEGLNAVDQETGLWSEDGPQALSGTHFDVKIRKIGFFSQEKRPVNSLKISHERLEDGPDTDQGSTIIERHGCF